jgi:hypothetical protein
MCHPKPLLLSCAAGIALLVFIVSCHKSSTPAPEDISYATDNVTTEQTFNDVENISDEAASVPSGSTFAYGSAAVAGNQCATATQSGDSITVDFGAKDCMCSDGRNRRGKIIVTYTGAHYTDVGSVHTITFDNYFQNDNKVTGTKTVTNMGLNALGQPYFDVSVNGSVTLNGGGTISTSWTRVRIWTAGYNTPGYQADDIFQVIGSGKMTCINGAVTNINITDTLVLANSCRWVEAGSVTFTLANGANRILNYGNTPVCDDQATLTLGNGTVKNITLP